MRRHMAVLQKMIWAACLLSVGLTLLDMLSPGRKYEKQLRILFSLMFLIGVFGPLAAGKIDLSRIGGLGGDVSAFASANVPINGSGVSGNRFSAGLLEERMRTELQRTAEENAALSLRNLLEEAGFPVENISVRIHIGEDNGISISEAVIQTAQPSMQQTAEKYLQEHAGIAVRSANGVQKVQGASE